MQLICISRGSYSYGAQLAELLAAKLGYACIGREELTDGATDEGIPIGKIETAIMKRQPLSGALAVEADRYKAYVTAKLCERALQGGVVYHGRTGHLVLHGVRHVLRIKTIADVEERVRQVMNRLKLNRDKARSYIDAVDDDIHRWVRVVYNVDWNDPSLYDTVINFSQLTVDNAASALVPFTQLPDFQSTPASNQVVQDLLIAAMCRLAIGSDERTHDLAVTVRAERGTVTVTYLPHQASLASALPSVLEKIPGVSSFVCTVASTSILFIQEQFDPDTDSFQHLIEIAEKWNAAVELVRLTSNEDGVEQTAEDDDRILSSVESESESESIREDNGGILDDDIPEPLDCEELGCGIPETMDRLIRVGRAGAVRTVHGGVSELVRSLTPVTNYSLVVVGDVFLSRAAGVRKRMKRDFIALLSDRLHGPVIGTEDLKSQFLFGPRQMMSMIGYFLLSVAMIWLVMVYQHELLSFLLAKGTLNRILAMLAVVTIAPTAAFVIGGFYHNVLKLAKLE